MDKYEYNLKLDQMKALAAEEDYGTAAEIAASINWRKIKNVNALLKAGEIYEKAERYEESREVLLMAYDRSPIGRVIVYRLANLAVKMNNLEEAEDYYKEFVEAAPHDNLKYVLQYEINKAQGAAPQKLITILEELKEQEYSEEWTYELAKLYHQAGMSDKCIETCDEIILWFGDGPYVEGALELKMLYQPLNKQQEEKYRLYHNLEDEGVEVNPEDELMSGEIIHEPVKIPDVRVPADRFNTQNLQKALEENIRQIMEATEKEEVEDSMDSIKKLVEDFPYLQIPLEREEDETVPEKIPHIETDQEINDSLKNSFQEFLEERDGQMSLFVPEQGNRESQVSGQMSIDDVLSEWEKTKHAAETALQEAEQKKLKSAKARALQEAGDIMERLAKIIPKLDSGLTPNELLKEQYLNGTPMEDEQAAEMVANMNLLLQQEIDRISDENAQIDARIGEQLATAESDIAAEEEAASDSEAATAAGHHTLTEWDFLAQIEEALQTGKYGVQDTEPVPEEEVPEIRQEEEPPVTTREDALPEIQFLREIKNAEPETEEIKQATKRLPGRTKRLPDVKAVKSVNTNASPVADASQASGASKSGPVPKIQETPKLHNAPEAFAALSKEQKKIFSYFVSIKGMEKQLCRAINGVKLRLSKEGSASSGNIIISGGEGSGKTMLATEIVEALQKEIGKPNGKTGKIDAAALNKRDAAALLGKVAGGCLIIEKAGGISKEMAVRLSVLLENDTSGVLVIMEDTKQGIEKALSKDAGFASKFTEKIMIPVFSSDELVTFARSYANEQGYTIDEMGTLALYNCISNIQKIDRATTLTEVKDIIDHAIGHVERGGLKKVFSIITSKRYDDDDYIILHEKDFDL